MQSSVAFQLEALFPLLVDRPFPYFQDESLELPVRPFSDLRCSKLQSMTLNKWIVVLQKLCIKIGFSS